MCWKSFLNSFMASSSTEVESYSLNRALRPREPGFLLFGLRNDAARAAFSRPLQQLHPESEIGNAHAHRLEERYVVRARAPAAGGDKPGERHHLVPPGGSISSHELARELLHAGKIVDGHNRRARKDVLREFLPVRRDRAHGVQVGAFVEHC